MSSFNSDGVLCITGDWGNFVSRKKLRVVEKHILSMRSEELHIRFEGAKITLLFAEFLAGVLQKSRVGTVYIQSDDTQVTNILRTLAKKNVRVFLNGSQVDLKKTRRVENEGKRMEARGEAPIWAAPPAVALKTLAGLGKYVCGLCDTAVCFLNFVGAVVCRLPGYFLNPDRSKANSMVFHTYEAGFKSLPTSVITSFIVGYAVTLQTAMQLNDIGAPLVSINASAKLSLREIGPFILALVVAGRSASSFTAQIGSMKLTEEISAMQAVAFDPYNFLVVPRILALTFIMPLMVFVTDIATLIGSLLAINVVLDIGFSQYIDVFRGEVGAQYFWIGIIKAPIFGAIVSIIGCFRGLQCRNDTSLVGKLTTRSVVDAIFWIIVANTIFSIAFSKVQ